MGRMSPKLFQDEVSRPFLIVTFKVGEFGGF